MGQGGGKRRLGVGGGEAGAQGVGLFAARLRGQPSRLVQQQVFRGLSHNVQCGGGGIFCRDGRSERRLNRDIAFIHADQPATVKISAYDFSIYGGLEGVVEEISADTIEDRRGESFYLAKVRTQSNAITHRGRSLPIIPGMICTVDILTGKKTVLDFLLKPILKAQENALHER